MKSVLSLLKEEVQSKHRSDVQVSSAYFVLVSTFV